MGVAKLTPENTLVPASKYAYIQHQRRYLLEDLPEGLTRASAHLQMTDNYITGTRLRLRKIRNPQTNKWTLLLTQRFPAKPNDLSRLTITELYLDSTEYETLSVFEGNEIRKNRYSFAWEGHEFSVDMFLGDLFGLVTAEITFAAEEAAASFPKPNFALAEITNQSIFFGERLCQLTFDDIRAELKRVSILR